MARLTGESEIIQEPLVTKEPMPVQLVPPVNPGNPHPNPPENPPVETVEVPKSALEQLNETLQSLGNKIDALKENPGESHNGERNRRREERPGNPEPLAPAQPVVTNQEPPKLEPEGKDKKQKRNGLLRVFLGENHQ